MKRNHNPQAKEQIAASHVGLFNSTRKPRVAKVDELVESIRRVEKRKGLKLLDHMVEEAFSNSTVLIALAKKLIPDLKQIEGDINIKGNLSYLTDKEVLDEISNLTKKLEND